jgi:DNA-directed RNA polymerase specialized sigma24 family protein
MTTAHDEAMYREVEEMVKPIMTSNARRFARQLGMSPDEAMQEARLALLGALRAYDYNASRGGIYNYAKTAVRRHFLKLWGIYRTQSRRPHLRFVNGDGKRVAKPVKFAEHVPVTGTSRGEVEGDFMDMMVSPTCLSPEAVLVEHDVRRTARDFMQALEAALTERDREVLHCKFDPPRGLRMLMLDELAQEPTIALIGRYLNLSKNEVDWAIGRIRATALRLIASEFSDLSDLSILRSYVGG